MPGQTSPESAADKRPARPLPVFVRAAAFAGAWVPVLILIVVFVPRFGELFARLDESGELPAVTAWLLSLNRLNDALFYLPCLLFFVLLVVADVGAARLSRRSRRGKSLYWVWFVAVVVAGFLALNLVVVALLLPVMLMSTTI
jgi:hypothetical protein